MRPLQPQNNASEMTEAFTQAAEAWLLRARNPQADMVALDTVQHWQGHQDDVPHSASTPVDDGTQAARSAAAVYPARLIKIQGQQQSDVWLLPHDRPVLIGRSGKRTPPLDVDLWPDTGVSRRHALIWFDGEGWCIEDLRSKNGTLLDEDNIRGQRAIRLAPGTKLQLGHTILMLTVLDQVGEIEAEPGDTCVLYEDGTPVSQDD
jgi:hypothetical protein